LIDCTFEVTNRGTLWGRTVALPSIPFPLMPVEAICGATLTRITFVGLCLRKNSKDSMSGPMLVATLDAADFDFEPDIMRKNGWKENKT